MPIEEQALTEPTDSPDLSPRGWLDDRVFLAVIAFGLLVGALILQGIPYWDSDFSILFRTVQPKSVSDLVFEWLSPISQDTTNWGYLDRQVQLIVYKLAYLMAGYNPWPYLLFRVLGYAAFAGVVYAWGLKLLPAESRSRYAAATATAFLLVAPGPIAAMVWIADFAPLSELAFAALGLILWLEIEKTPVEWTSFDFTANPQQRRWLVKWIGLAIAVYLCYKTKADVKLLAPITILYLALIRRKQWKIFAIPMGLMVLLAVPWNPALFKKLPPFIPGSSGASETWMWRPASLEHLTDFIWSSGPYDMLGGTLSMAGLLGPFLLIAIAGLLIFNTPPVLTEKISLSTPRQRAHLFIHIWLLAVLAGATTLPPISYFFRIRYGLLTLTPVAILLASVFGWFDASRHKLPRWAIAACLALLALQTGVNVVRSARHRRELGAVAIGVDQAYDYVTNHYPTDTMALLPPFLSYDYRLDAVPAITSRHKISGLDELVKTHIPNRTTVLGWQGPTSAALQTVAHFTGCLPSIVFDVLDPCPKDGGVYVMRYTGAVNAAPETTKNGPTPEELLDQSNVLCRANKPRECIAAAQEALKLRPNYAEAYNNIAAAYETMSMWDEAIAAAKEAIRLKPDFQLAKNNLNWSESQKKLQQTGPSQPK